MLSDFSIRENYFELNRNGLKNRKEDWGKKGCRG